MTCEVRLADGAFEERAEKSILKKTEKDNMVHLVEDLCSSDDCESNDIDAVDDSYPIDTERTDKTFDVGARLESFSGEAAGYVQSSGSLIYLKTVILFITYLCFML